VIIPALMNFFADSENSDPRVRSSGHRSLESESVLEVGFDESAHEVLDLIEDSDISGPEGSTEEAIALGISPAMLVRAIPDTHCK